MCLTHGSSHLAVCAYDLQPSCQATQQHLVLYKPHKNKLMGSHNSKHNSIQRIFNLRKPMEDLPIV